MIAYPFRGKGYVCRGKMGYLPATVEYALAHSELGIDFADHLRQEVLSDTRSRFLDLSCLTRRGLFQFSQLSDLCSGETSSLFNDRLVVPPRRVYWLTDQRRPAAL